MTNRAAMQQSPDEFYEVPNNPVEDVEHARTERGDSREWYDLGPLRRADVCQTPKGRVVRELVGGRTLTARDIRWVRAVARGLPAPPKMVALAETLGRNGYLFGAIFAQDHDDSSAARLATPRAATACPRAGATRTPMRCTGSTRVRRPRQRSHRSPRRSSASRGSPDGSEGSDPAPLTAAHTYNPYTPASLAASRKEGDDDAAPHPVRRRFDPCVQTVRPGHQHEAPAGRVVLVYLPRPRQRDQGGPGGP